MIRWLKRLVLLVVLFLLVAQFFRPSRSNPPIDPEQEIGARLPVDAGVAAILERSCNDCHSNRTVWPWYSTVAPVSWFIARDVNEGREEMNLSEWGTFNARKVARRLEQLCTEVTDGEMPGIPYTLLHPEAKLTDTDIQTICSWAQTARKSVPAETGGTN